MNDIYMTLLVKLIALNKGYSVDLNEEELTILDEAEKSSEIYQEPSAEQEYN